jgi:hypothetical protein
MFKLQIKILFLIFISTNINAQDGQLELIKKWRSPDGRNIDYYYVSDNKNPDEVPNIKIVGTLYINEEFQPTQIFTTGGEVFEGLFMRYNAFHDLMEFKEFVTDHDSLIGYLKKTPDLILKIGEQVFDFVTQTSNADNGTYFEVLYRGLNVKLYKKTNKRFTEARIARTSFETDFPRRYQDRHTYFFVTTNGKHVELKGSQNKLLTLINYRKEELKKFIQQQKLELSEENDLKKLIIHLDSLL